MRKNLMVAIALMVAVLASSCQKNVEVNNSDDGLKVSISITRLDHPEDANVFFVKNLKTPFYEFGGHKLSGYTNNGAYWGVQKNDSIYCYADYSCSYTINCGDSTVVVATDFINGRKVFFKDALTEEPRETVFWLMQLNIAGLAFDGLDQFLETICPSDEFTEYQKTLKKKIQREVGKDEVDKLRIYTLRYMIDITYPNEDEEDSRAKSQAI